MLQMLFPVKHASVHMHYASVFISTHSCVIDFRQFVYLTVVIPKISTFKWLASPRLLLSFPVCFKVRIYHFAILVFYGILYTATGWRSTFPCCWRSLLPDEILSPEDYILFTSFCLVLFDCSIIIYEGIYGINAPDPFSRVCYRSLLSSTYIIVNMVCQFCFWTLWAQLSLRTIILKLKKNPFHKKM